jgi:tetratricopeptide (TPR) repeat protein
MPAPSTFTPKVPARRRRTALLLATAAVVVVAAAGGGVRLWADHHQRAAQRALDAHQLPEARRHLEACLRVRPHSAEAHFLAARAARRDDDLAAATRHLEACDALQGVTPAGALEQALLRAQQFELSRVEADLRSLVESGHPDRTLILEALAKGYMKDDRIPLAIDCLDALLERETTHVPALLLRGRALESLRQTDEAHEDYQRAVELAPDSADARLRLADILAEQGEVRTAVAHYEYLRARPPTRPAAVLGLARCRLDLHELDEAERLLQGLLADEPDDVAAVAEWGRVVVRQGRAAEAESRLRTAVARAAHDRDACLVLHLCLDAQGKTDEAADCLRRLREIEDDQMHIGLLRLRLAQGEGDPIATRCEMGRLMLRNGRETEGVRVLSIAVERDPSCAPAHLTLADYYERKGRPDEAAAHRRAARRGPTAPQGKP